MNRISRRTPSQKWPRGPRFTAGSVTGFAISHETTMAPTSKPDMTIWYVHDAAFGYEICGVFFDKRLLDRYNGRLYKRRLHQSAEQAARHYTLILNRTEKATA